jgi:hypothetical protein
MNAADSISRNAQGIAACAPSAIGATRRLRWGASTSGTGGTAARPLPRDTHGKPQGRLVQVEGEGGSVLPAEQALAGQPGGHPVVLAGALTLR